jgi:hypothetical protein
MAELAEIPLVSSLYVISRQSLSKLMSLAMSKSIVQQLPERLHSG